jgi:hypothetical protein
VLVSQKLLDENPTLQLLEGVDLNADEAESGIKRQCSDAPKDPEDAGAAGLLRDPADESELADDESGDEENARGKDVRVMERRREPEHHDNDRERDREDGGGDSLSALANV